MSQPGLDVFSLRDAVVGEYKKFATSFTTIFADDIRAQIDSIYAQDRFWPERLIQINPSYKRTATVDGLAREGVLHSKTADIFRASGKADGSLGETLSLYKHQEQAIALASQGESPSRNSKGGCRIHTVAIHTGVCGVEQGPHDYAKRGGRGQGCWRRGGTQRRKAYGERSS